MSKVEPLDLQVIWEDGGVLPKIIVGVYEKWPAGECGIYQAVDMITMKLNELIESMAED